MTAAYGPHRDSEGAHRLTNHLQNPALVSDELVYQHETTVPEQLVANLSKQCPRALFRTCRRLLPDLR